MGAGFTKSTSKIGHMLNKHSECLRANLAFQSTSNNLVGMLSVGLITGSGAITSYVIDWHLDSVTGPVVLTSGYNPSVAVNAIHPFVNEPVQSGNLYAVVRYIVINGIKYAPVFRQGQYSPDLKICFNYVPVSAVGCSLGTSPTGNYSHTFNYNNTQDPSVNAYRKISFKLNTDGSTKYLAWYFYAQTVADRLDIYYQKINDPDNLISLYSLISGINSNINDLSLNPKRRTYATKIVNDISGIPYTVGDQLIIEITPRVYEPTNSNTNWTLYLKCLSSFTDYIPPAGSNIIDPATFSAFTFDQASCSYILTWKNRSNYVPPTHYYDYFDTRWFNAIETDGTNYNSNYNKTTGLLKVRYKFTASYIHSQPGYNITCNNSVANINYKKVGNVITITCLNSTDYNYLKNAYNAMIALSRWTGYTADVNSDNHYISVNLQIIVANSCGDAANYYYKRFSKGTTYNFNDGNFTVTITLATITNDHPDPLNACDSRKSYWQTIVDAINLNVNEADWEYNTRAIYTGSIYLTAESSSFVKDVNSSRTIAYYLEGKGLADPTPAPTGWRKILNLYSGYTNQNLDANSVFGYDMGNIKIIIDNESDPTNNYRLYSYIKQSDGQYNSVNYPELVRALVNGVVKTKSDYYFELTFNNIANVPVADVNSVANWNTFFDFPTNGTPIESLSITSNTIRFLGATNVKFKDNLFLSNPNILSVVDNGCVFTLGNSAFKLSSINNVNFPAATTMYDSCFQGSSIVTPLLPKITDIPMYAFTDAILLDSFINNTITYVNNGYWAFKGCSLLREVIMDAVTIFNHGSGSLFANDVNLQTLSFRALTRFGLINSDGGYFSGITGKTINVTVANAVATGNGGNPDPDLATLIANNTVNLTVV